MRNAKQPPQKPLSTLEHVLMDYLWSQGRATADEIRLALLASHPLKDATIRTLLRRLEEKGYASHVVEGRTFVYSGSTGRERVAAGAVRQMIDRFWGGSVKDLVLGLVDDELLRPDELRELAAKIEKRKGLKRK